MELKEPSFVFVYWRYETRAMRPWMSHWSSAFSISGVRLIIWMGQLPWSSLASTNRLTSSSAPVNSTMVTPCMSTTMDSVVWLRPSIFLIMLSISNMDKKLTGPLSCQMVFLVGSWAAESIAIILASSLSAKVVSALAADADADMVCMPRPSRATGSWLPQRASQIMASAAVAGVCCCWPEGNWINSKAFILLSVWGDWTSALAAAALLAWVW
mmetsp:Transcript_16453/g.35829  ORF Transcript_16453/g.35829 Transcript_16453/m.35829 type:complete len:213 (-) Transcript_16453:1521-2159(-)